MLANNYEMGNLYYQASIDGYKCEDFHRKCDEMGPSLTLISLKDGPIIGGATRKSWSGLSGYQNDRHAKIFNLTANLIFECKSPKFAIKNSADLGP